MAILFLSRFLATKAFNADAHLIKTNIVKTNDVEAFNAGTYLNKTNIVKTTTKNPTSKTTSGKPNEPMWSYENLREYWLSRLLLLSIWLVRTR